ncbi:hypothetical protein OEZ86_001264 [Tetradesmus obliquus]|nr:hypothetical protein OEZ86_001264 [Tetradesmus obliquus]
MFSRLPSIREFIQTECPVRGLDGQLREQARAATLTASVIAVDKGALVVPGERRLFDVPEQQLEQIIADRGRVIICCFEPSDSSSSRRRLAAPKKGSWACLGSVAGLQRLPGSSRALVRVVVADRVAVQALDSSNPAVSKAQAALLRDRWAYFVRAAALEQHLAAANAGTAPAGSDVAGALSQVQDAAAELLQVLQQLADAVAAVADGQQGGKLQQLLVQHDAADELQELLGWCQLQGLLDDARSSAAAVALDSDLLERAWRLSFTPFAAKGLANALSNSNSSSRSPEDGCRAVLEMTDLGLRLEEALDTAVSMRSSLATQLAMNSL